MLSPPSQRAPPLAVHWALSLVELSLSTPSTSGRSSHFSLLTDAIPRDTWRAVFYFCAALAGVCFFGGMYAIQADPPSTEKDRRVDWLGSFLVTAGLTLIIFILAQGEIAEPKQWGTACMFRLVFTEYDD